MLSGIHARLAARLTTQSIRIFKATSAFSTSTVATPSAAASKPAMFCMQCEQTKDGKGCTTVGVCGKDPQTAALQDLLIHNLKGLAEYAHEARQKGMTTGKVDTWILDAMFATLTNVNFSPARISELIHESQALKMDLRNTLHKKSFVTSVFGGGHRGDAFQETVPERDLAKLTEQAKKVGILSRGDPSKNDVLGLEELVTYGLKGLCAYAAHAAALGRQDPAVTAFIYEALAYLAKPMKDQTVGDLLGIALKTGEINIRAMELLNQGHISRFGAPVPTKVRTSPVAGKCILVSGHDLHDLEKVLQMTDGTGINVYTHGEMLPAHGYPGLKKYKHLVGNYGGAWQLQKLEFATFPGPILLTSNCLVEPRESYRDRIFTTNAVGFDGVKHLTNQQYGPLVEKAKECEGFTDDEPETYTMTGFGHDAVLGIAGDVINAVQEGKIKKFLLIGGCDGSESERSYYRNLAMKLPPESVVLTLGCAKFRFNKMFDKFGNVPGTGIPRMLDIGQCNDSYSAIQIAVALANAFKCDVNALPLQLVLSWFEQKAVAVLLSLLHLGIKGIHIGPALPAFVTPNVLNVLVDKFQLTPIGNVDSDLKKFMGPKV